MQNYVLIPRDLPARTDLGDKRIIAYAAALFTDWNGVDISPLLVVSGYSPSNRNKSGVRVQYQQLIDGFVESGLLVSPPGSFTSWRSMEYGFGIIKESEFNRIVHAKNELGPGYHINQAHALLLLAYIRCNMLRVPGRPTYYSNLLSRISDNIGISSRSVSSVSSFLERFGIIHNEELPRYKDPAGRWHSNVRIFLEMNSLVGDPGYSWVRETERATALILASQA